MKRPTGVEATADGATGSGAGDGLWCRGATRRGLYREAEVAGEGCGAAAAAAGDGAGDCVQQKSVAGPTSLPRIEAAIARLNARKAAELARKADIDQRLAGVKSGAPVSRKPKTAQASAAKAEKPARKPKAEKAAKPKAEAKTGEAEGREVRQPPSRPSPQRRRTRRST